MIVELHDSALVFVDHDDRDNFTPALRLRTEIAGWLADHLPDWRRGAGLPHRLVFASIEEAALFKLFWPDACAK